MIHSASQSERGVIHSASQSERKRERESYWVNLNKDQRERDVHYFRKSHFQWDKERERLRRWERKRERN